MQDRKTKEIEWLGSSKEDLRDFPPVARQRAGYQLEVLQDGDEPDDWKPMKTVGPGVQEIRIKCEDGAFPSVVWSCGTRATHRLLQVG